MVNILSTFGYTIGTPIKAKIQAINANGLSQISNDNTNIVYASSAPPT
jgi:hypothetical protein